jgi:hypothetical protein
MVRFTLDNLQPRFGGGNMSAQIASHDHDHDSLANVRGVMLSVYLF